MKITIHHEKNVWYCAYGSNMSKAKFTGSRGIIPLATARVRLPGWTLCMDIAGMPYQEPAFSSIASLAQVSQGATDTVAGPGTDVATSREVIGVAYLLTPHQLVQVIASEGGGIAYSDVVVLAEPITEKDRLATGGAVMVHTLGTALARRPAGHPSLRYMDIVLSGAAEAQVPSDYYQFLVNQPVYTPPGDMWGRVGAQIFVAVWGPLMGGMERLAGATVRAEDGLVPAWVLVVVRAFMVLMWVYHDYLHAPLWGRGDGL